jgi:hypothetical protein
MSPSNDFSWSGSRWREREKKGGGWLEFPLFIYANICFLSLTALTLEILVNLSSASGEKMNCF